MVAVPNQLHYTHDEYFALEQAEDHRYEYLAGEVYAMVGGSESHALIASNLLTELAIGLRGKPCRVYGADMKLYIAQHDHFCYPDVMVLCEGGLRERLYVANPTLVVEVLSDNTEAYDRGDKFARYRAIPELRHYLLVNQHRPMVECFERAEGGAWRYVAVEGPEQTLHLAPWDLRVPLAEIYRNVEFA